MLGGFHQGSPSGELNWGRKRHSYPRVKGNGAASVTPASSSRPLLTQHTGRNWLNAEIVESCEGVRCRSARSSADVCQRGAMHQRMGGGGTAHPQGARLTLRLVRQGDGLHYPVGQPLFGDSLPFLLPSVADKELLGASEPFRGQCLQVHHLITEGCGGNLGHVSRPGSQGRGRRLTGGNAYLRKARGQLCASASVLRGPSVRKKYS